MPKKKITVVGAGLSGLVAAINLARDGWDVRVLDKEKRQGGRPEFRPDGAASPFDLEALEAYTGIDISPACKHIDKMVLSIYGKRTEVQHQQESHIFMVERGSRKTSLDTLLVGLAEEAGVQFEWGFAIKSPHDVSELPDRSIIATGLDVHGFEAMGIPYVSFWGWFAKGKVDEERTVALAYVDDFTVDYAFGTVVNKAAFGLLFQREKPPGTHDKEKFESVLAQDGLELKGWSDLIGGAAPHRSISNPILFKNNMIVIGTLAGVMEPMLNFGMLGAMLSGKIGAVAVTDMGRAYEEFRKLTSFFRRSLALKRLHDRCPSWVRRAAWSAAPSLMADATADRINRGMMFVPGYGNF